MRPSPVRLVRILPRSEVTNVASKIQPLPEPVRSDTPKINIFQLLQQRKEAAGASYPSNIRFEPAVSKKDFYGVPADLRRQLRDMTKEK